MREGLILALDFGGTKHTAGVINGKDLQARRAWRSHRRVFSPPKPDVEYDLQTMIHLAREMLAGEIPAAIGVSFGGPVDFSTGTVRLSHHVPGWENVPLKQVLEEAFGAPACIDNDANVAALGEHRFGAGRGSSSLMYITVSTGVGGGWILNDKPWRGAQGMAGEIGHTVVDPSGPACLCGNQGCVERLASGPFMAENARERLLAEPERGAVLRDLIGGDLDSLTAQQLSQAAEAGDELSWDVLQEGAWALGVGIGNAANLINPELFVLGGGVTKSGERYWQAVRQAARETALPEIELRIVPAELGDDAPLWGAVALAMEC